MDGPAIVTSVSDLENLVSAASRGGLDDVVALRTEILRLVRTGDVGSAEITGYLRTASPKAWTTLDSAMRAGYGRLEQPVGSAESDEVVAVGLASMARDGHLRERAVIRLGAVADPLAGPFLASRTTDWVTQVAETATATLEARLRSDRALVIASAPLIFSLEQRRRSTTLGEVILGQAATHPEVRDALLEAPDVRTRRRVIGDRSVLGALSIERLVTIAISEMDNVVAAKAGVAAVARMSDRGYDTALELLLVGPALVRAAVLDALPSDDRAPSTGTRHLFDRSTSVRGAAQRLLARTGGDAAATYRAALQTRTHTPIAVIELAQLGNKSDHQLVLACLHAAEAPTRRAAVNAARWVAGGRLIELLVPMLSDEASGVTRAAERRLRGVASSIDRQVLTGLTVAPLTHSRRAAYRLMRRRSAPERLEADFVALADVDEANRRDALGDLRSWLFRDAARAPRADLQTRRRLSGQLLEVPSGLRPKEVEMIRFHAALRPVDLVS